MYEEIERKLIQAAKECSLVHYEELAPDLGLNLERDHDRAEIGRVLGEISKEEVGAGRPMLSALVVHKGGDEMPGGGFFTLAQELGRYKGGDRKIWWAMELKALYDHWSPRTQAHGG